MSGKEALRVNSTLISVYFIVVICYQIIFAIASPSLKFTELCTEIKRLIMIINININVYRIFNEVIIIIIISAF